MAHLHALFIDARAHAHKGNAVPVAWVHVGLDFEHKTGKLLLACFDKSLFSGTSQRGRRPLNKVVEHLSHTKVAQRCAEKYRRHTPRQVGIQVELRSEEHTSELQSRGHLVCSLLLEKKKRTT